MYPAQNGDAFLLSTSKTNILIDGGYTKTFKTYIQKDLEELAAREASLDLAVVTHIDTDHIGGIIHFLSLNGCSTKRNIIAINNVWHNSLRCMTSIKKEAKLSHQEFEVIDAINKRGHPKELQPTTSGFNEISARQGSTLAALLKKGEYVWNEGDGTQSICTDSVRDKRFKDGLIKVLSPSRKRLENLVSSWKRDLRHLGCINSIGSNQAIDDAFELNFEHKNKSSPLQEQLISAGGIKSFADVYKPDNSVSNGSSIATIIVLNGIRLLMLADAFAEDVLTELRKMKATGESMVFDAIKISHHGSNHNTSPELLSFVDSPRYFISSDGSKHNHPDIELLRAIVDRQACFTRTLYFNYSTPESKNIKKFQTTTGATFVVKENATDWITINKEC